ncbi:MAG: hypothetical protein AAB263_17255 [Planctomycetota bacterium]
MAKDSPLLIAALLWLATGAPVAAEPSPDIAANPAAVTTQAEVKINESTATDALVTCEYGCEDHREGTEICINKKQHRCGKQGWHPTGLICAAPPPVTR